MRQPFMIDAVKQAKEAGLTARPCLSFNKTRRPSILRSTLYIEEHACRIRPLLTAQQATPRQSERYGVAKVSPSKLNASFQLFLRLAPRCARGTFVIPSDDILKHVFTEEDESPVMLYLPYQESDGYRHENARMDFLQYLNAWELLRR